MVSGAPTGPQSWNADSRALRLELPGVPPDVTDVEIPTDQGWEVGSSRGHCAWQLRAAFALSPVTPLPFRTPLP